MITAVNANRENIHFGALHRPKSFGEMMNYVYRRTFKHYGNFFENKDIVRLTTNIDGKDVSGLVNFREGKYKGLILDAPYNSLKGFKKRFMNTALQNYLAKLPEKNRNKTCHLEPNKRFNMHVFMKSDDFYI